MITAYHSQTALAAHLHGGQPQERARLLAAEPEAAVARCGEAPLHDMLLQLEHANKLEKNVLKHNKSSGQLECTWIGLLCGKNRSTSVTSINGVVHLGPTDGQVLANIMDSRFHVRHNEQNCIKRCTLNTFKGACAASARARALADSRSLVADASNVLSGRSPMLDFDCDDFHAITANNYNWLVRDGCGGASAARTRTEATTQVCESQHLLALPTAGPTGGVQAGKPALARNRQLMMDVATTTRAADAKKKANPPVCDLEAGKLQLWDGGYDYEWLQLVLYWKFQDRDLRARLLATDPARLAGRRGDEA